MATLTVRGLDDETRTRLRIRKDFTDTGIELVDPWQSR
jgi:plasmid stability protein